MQPESSESDQMLYSFLTENQISNRGFYVSEDYMSTMPFLCGSPSSTSSYYPLAISGIGETLAQDRAIAALRNHKEAERRRRERINSHLNKLRNVLSCSSKTDKATLLAKVVQRVKELKQQTLEISDSDQTLLPSESDEISVLHYGDYSNDGHIIFKASLCCDERSDLLPDLMEILKSLHMKTLQRIDNRNKKDKKFRIQAHLRRLGPSSLLCLHRKTELDILYHFIHFLQKKSQVVQIQNLHSVM
ncbi:unnamed protein product [Eruca vesicaria subsp. sativa]|uniref:BHLH domain-containing protein n=1 Tax=Eruca vesicaria subsp. sativa TaxID=29727 RepID=A0ABC8KLB2_ERUVS|nr:unnamed protein product [Eruca vesicaria subsp. sativa]